MNRNALWSIFLLTLWIPPPARAGVAPHEWSIGLLSNGAAIGFQWHPRWAVGAQVQRATGVWVYGLRQRRYFNPKAAQTHFFWGLEENWVTFDIDDVRGHGWAVAGSLGLAHFLTRRLALEVEAGPAYIGLEDSAEEVSNQGLDFVANVGLSWHWGGR